MQSSFRTALTCIAVAASSASAQWPPTALKNVKVLPHETSVNALLDTMSGFTRALGVPCSYCHVGGSAIPFTKLDFASDSLPTKAKAREMLRMVSAINGEHLSKLGDRRDPPIVVTCATCHRGVTQPRPLQQVLLIAYDAGGVDSTEATYRALRTRYYGRSAYDFGEVPLTDVAAVVLQRGKLPDALRLYMLNVEFSPQSGFALRQAAGAQLAARDTAGAVLMLQRALVINPNDAQSKNALQVLRKP